MFKKGWKKIPRYEEMENPPPKRGRIPD